MAEAIDENPRAVLGGNLPFLELYREHNAALPGYLAQEHADIIAASIELKLDFESAPSVCDTDEAEKEMTELGARLSKFIKQVEAQRTIDKAPTLAANRVVDNFFADLSGKIEPCLKAMSQRVNAYKNEKAAAAKRAQEEVARKAREAAAEATRIAEEAQRAAQEQEDAAARETAQKEALRAAAAAEKAEKEADKAANKPAPSTHTRAAGSASSVQTTRWTGEIMVLDDLDLDALRPFINLGALDSAVKQYARTHKGTKPLAGAKIYEDTSTSFRA